MPLGTHVQNRYGAQYLINLTNPQLPSATVIDATRLLNAANDVIGMFDIYANVEYDDTIDSHIAVAAPCVIDRLLVYAGQMDATDMEERCKTRLQELAMITGRNRPQPTTNSILQPSTEQAGTGPTRPDFDRGRRAAILPSAPGEQIREDFL